MKISAFLNDYVFSGQEQILNSAVQKYKVHKSLEEIQTKIWGKSFILADDHLSESHSSDLQFGEEEGIGLIDRLILAIQLLSLFLVFKVDVFDFVRAFPFLVVGEIIEDGLSVLKDRQTCLQLGFHLIYEISFHGTLISCRIFI